MKKRSRLSTSPKFLQIETTDEVVEKNQKEDGNKK